MFILYLFFNVIDHLLHIRLQAHHVLHELAHPPGAGHVAELLEAVSDVLRDSKGAKGGLGFRAPCCGEIHGLILIGP